MKRNFWPVISSIAAAAAFTACASACASTAAEQKAEGSQASGEAAALESSQESSKQEFRDAYLKGRIVSELLLDSHVSVFDFRVKVDNGVAWLSGTVDKSIERDIAIEIARGIDGVKDVHSSIELKPGTRDERTERQRETLGQSLDDATVTASVKTKLLANANTSGLRIHVNTNRGTVTLSGHVQTSEEKDLAGRIAQNTQGAAKVENLLVASNRR